MLCCAVCVCIVVYLFLSIFLILCLAEYLPVYIVLLEYVTSLYAINKRVETSGMLYDRSILICVHMKFLL